MTDLVARLNEALDGRYRIERELGQGGMATVYLADDLRHERKVALKVLKPELAAVVGGERFLAEIKTTANLQHPHILPLFDSGEADGFLFYVMPYVEGESLRERLEREKQLPVDEAVAIAKKVAGALHAAHGRGVIHRDIKPANILLAGGEPVVADFGIALAVQEAGGGRLTDTGLSVGTPYYMSPEQATADRAPNAASDVYSLGCVLYETLVGEPPYAGSSAQAVLGKIIAGEAPRAKDGRPAVPANVDAVVQKALEKLPADRFPTTEQFASALADRSFRAGPYAHGASNEHRRRSIGLAWPTLAAALGVLALFGWLRPGPTPAGPVSFDFHMPDGYAMVDGLVPVLAVSPDGRTLAYRNGNRVYVRELEDFQGRPLAGTEGVWHAFFSPDGETLGLLDGSSFKQVPAGGGPVVDLLGEQTEPEGGHWGEDGRIVYSAAWGYNGIRAATPGEPGIQQLTSV
ncbi:MAG: protein kinase domain-containing protein, partial [Longimicrobiales bacterium]